MFDPTRTWLLASANKQKCIELGQQVAIPARLEKAEIVGQFGKQVIVCAVSGCLGVGSLRGDVVVLGIDQHAADERIRVEAIYNRLHLARSEVRSQALKIFDSYQRACGTGPSADQIYSKILGGTEEVCSLVPPIMVEGVDSRDVNAIRERYWPHFCRWGIGLAVRERALGPCVELTHIPAAIAGRFQTLGGIGDASSHGQEAQLARELVETYLEWLEKHHPVSDTGNSQGSWDILVRPHGD
ncbi:hypothetical protein EV182_005359, partial [Spiromyces aspiralis]